jgi:hypothetical protein
MFSLKNKLSNKSLFSILGCLLFSFGANAQNISVDELASKSRRTTDLITREGESLSQSERREVDNYLDKIQKLVLGLDSGGEDTSRIYSAVCHIDDDPQFDEGQNVQGTLYGEHLKDLIDDCKALAQAAYGSNGSSGLVGIAVDMTKVPSYYQAAECHIDDDPQFDYGQKIIGTIAAEKVGDLFDDCQLIASSTYGAQGSSGLQNLNVGRTAPANYVSAECHIDDDPQFDAGQVIVGRIWGKRIGELVDACGKAAKARYGDQGSSGLQNIQNN